MPGPHVRVLLEVEVLDELVTVPGPLVVVGEGVGVGVGVGLFDVVTQFVPSELFEVCLCAAAAAARAWASLASAACAAARIAATTLGLTTVTRRTMVVVRCWICGVCTTCVFAMLNGGPSTGTTVARGGCELMFAT